jgi:hypothetical protein
VFEERMRELARRYLAGQPGGEERVRRQADEMKKLFYSHLPEHEGMRIALDALECMWALQLDQQLAQRKMLRQLGFDVPADEAAGVEPPPDFDARVAELARKCYPGDPEGEARVRQDVEHTVRFAYPNLPRGEAMRIALSSVEVFAAMGDAGLAGMFLMPGLGALGAGVMPSGVVEEARKRTRRKCRGGR